LPCLDGARGLAIALVLLDHANDSGMKFFSIDMNRAGKYGVYLFFVLSAFLLTRQLCIKSAGELARGGTWMNYAFRRFMRIFPLYALVLVILHPGEVFTHLLLRAGRGPFWTIPVEVKYYMLLPFVAFALFWLGRKRWMAAAVWGLGACAVGEALFLGERSWSLENSVNLAGNVLPFLMGSAVAAVYGVLEGNEVLQRRLAWWLECGAIIAVIVSFLRIPCLYNWVFRIEPLYFVHKFGSDPAVCGALWGVFLLGLLAGKGWVRGAMGWMPLRFLGLISFSLYLWHRKIVDMVRGLPLASPVLLLLFLVIVIAIATVSYLLVERPVSRLRLRSRREPVGASAGASAG
jgi:peptidoglycan/LPS O-acetylase OafA/YrhL